MFQQDIISITVGGILSTARNDNTGFFPIGNDDQFTPPWVDAFGRIEKPLGHDVIHDIRQALLISIEHLDPQKRLMQIDLDQGGIKKRELRVVIGEKGSEGIESYQIDP